MLINFCFVAVGEARAYETSLSREGEFSKNRYQAIDVMLPWMKRLFVCNCRNAKAIDQVLTL